MVGSRPTGASSSSQALCAARRQCCQVLSRFRQLRRPYLPPASLGASTVSARSCELYVFYVRYRQCILMRRLHHILCTGHNAHFDEEDRPVQAAMHAASSDLGVWTKDPSFLLSGPLGYKPDDRRDPWETQGKRTRNWAPRSGRDRSDDHRWDGIPVG